MMKRGVRICCAMYCGKKHCEMWIEYWSEYWKLQWRVKLVRKQKALTKPGFILEVHDGSKFFADPFRKVRLCVRLIHWQCIKYYTYEEIGKEWVHVSQLIDQRRFEYNVLQTHLSCKTTFTKELISICMKRICELPCILQHKILGRRSYKWAYVLIK